MVEWMKKKKKMAINFDFIDIDTVEKKLYLFEDFIFFCIHTELSIDDLVHA